MVQTQIVPIQLGQGIDTKSDPRQLKPGKLSALENGLFTPGGEIVKRPGFSPQSTGPTAGIGLTTYNNELIELDGQSLWSLSQGQNVFNNKGTLVVTQLATSTVIRNTHTQTNADSAQSGSYACYAWIESYVSVAGATTSLGGLYSIVDNSTGQSVINAGTISANAALIKTVTLNNSFYFLYYDSSAQKLLYKTVSTSTPTVLSAAGTIAGDINTSTPAFDCSVIGTKIFIAYPNNTGTQASVYSLSVGGTLSSQANIASIVIPNVITIFGDSATRAWVGYSKNATASAIYGFVLNGTLGTVTTPTALGTVTTNSAINITGYMSGTGTATFYYEMAQTGSYVSDPLTPNLIYKNTLTTGGAIGTNTVFTRGAGLGSKVFTYNSNPYLWTTVQSPLQNSYFLLNGSAVVCAKLSPGVGGGYQPRSVLPTVNNPSSGVYQVASLIKDNLTSQSGTVFTQTGVVSAQITFPSTAPSKAMLGNNLHVAGGLIQMYDGASVVEHGYNLYPEGLTGTFSLSGGVIGPGNAVGSVNQYQYQAVYEWVDNQGQIHRSAPNPAVSVNLPASIAPIVVGGTVTRNSSTVTVQSATGIVAGQYVSAVFYNIATPPHVMAFPQNSTVTNVSGNAIVFSGTTGTSFIGTAPTDVLLVFSNYPQTLLAGFGGPIGGSTTTEFFVAAGTLAQNQTIYGIGANSGALSAGTYISGTAGGTYTISSPLISENSSGTQTGALPFYMSQDGGSISVTIPTLKLTQKNNVSIALYRTELNQDIFYRVSSPQSLTYSSTGSDSVTIGDTLADNQIIGNEQLYTTGGELENIEAAATNIITTFKSRALTVPAENPLSWEFSKQVIQGVPVEFSDSFIQNVDGAIGAVSAVGVLDEKIILFGPNTKYYVVGDGPAASGLNNDFSYPQKITGKSGCSNQASILEIPMGLLYQDQTRGIHLLTRALEEMYIGADVEQYNSSTVTSAQPVPGTKVVRMTLNTGQVLTYDYFYNQWGVDVYASAAVDSAIFQNQFTYLTGSGTAFSETSGTWSDNGSFIPLDFTTGWINLEAMQGFMRAKKLMILGTYFSPHTLNAYIYTDYNDTTPVQTVAIPVNSAPNVYQYRILLSTQKCEAIKIRIFDSGGSGQSFSLSSLSLEIGVKKGAQKLASAQGY